MEFCLQAVGLLLAAGHSRRFGHADKLHQPLADGRMLAVAAAQHLISALPQSVAVIREHDQALAHALATEGLQIVKCTEAQQEMSASLVLGMHYLRHPFPKASGVVIVLADMPFILPSTISAVAQQLDAGAGIVLPRYQGKRGHPVGFSQAYFEALCAISGDTGAREVITRHPQSVVYLECDDAGILMDIDTPDDLRSLDQTAKR